MRIGLDFDNTLACYERLFPAIAKRNGLLPKNFQGGKQDVKNALCQQPDGEQTWMALQGQVYGQHMQAAGIFDGVSLFLETCRKQNCTVYINSHKTQFGHFDEHRVDLRKAALEWMELNQFFAPNGFAIDPDHVFFADTRDEKIKKISELKLDLFIDDLEDVLAHSDFPTTTKPIQFLPNLESPSQNNWPCFHHWDDIRLKVFSRQEAEITSPLCIAQGLCNDDTINIKPGGTGGNNRLWHVIGKTTSAALKIYNHNPFDHRDRLKTERQALFFLQQCHEQCVPIFMAHAPQHHAALLSWIEGTPIDQILNSDIIQAVYFVSRLIDYGQHSNAKTIPLASETCLSGAELCSQVKARLSALERVACLYPELDTFLQDHLQPTTVSEATKLRIIGGDEYDKIDTNDRILSPSDFGFHNALRRADGTLVFLDFEYFGWDDPVKLVADFLLHPAMDMTMAQKQMFLDQITPLFSPSFYQRLKNHYFLYAIRWCAIILNPFIPHLSTATRTNDQAQLDTLQIERLQKAQDFFHMIFTKDRSFPYAL